MPLDPERAGSEGGERDSGARHFLSEGGEAAEARLAKERRSSLRWQHSAQRRRDRNRFLLLLVLLAAVLYFLWKRCSAYLPHGASGAH
ncbi:hypothetical protein [Verrucomicrobium sp. 3C]|uniref:hypothetical protein n=1 Tax=Verrucomicrobium sp. 3C TaxID=1134055 RepID=UPI000376584B|nr:hypothetical protein [Verrucomicrobium sp. 3C]